MLDSTNIACAPIVCRRMRIARARVCVCVAIRAEFTFRVCEIIIRTCYVNSVKSREPHMTRGLTEIRENGKKTYI